MYAGNEDKYNMKRIMIFGGTTEGRELAGRLAEENIFSTVFVATDYGEQVMEFSPCIEVKCGRLGVEEMKGQMESGTYTAIVDATHPFAQVVSENIRIAAKDSDLPIFRCIREPLYSHPDSSTTSRCVVFDTAASCADALAQTSGTILLTTGSKELSLFCSDASVRARLFARVLPGKESLALCYENGLEGKQIMAMQGPFTEEMNLALIHQTGAHILVTKESGHVGGTDSKITAAEKAGISCYLIRRPDSAGGQPGGKAQNGHTNGDQTNTCQEDFDQANGNPAKAGRIQIGNAIHENKDAGNAVCGFKTLEDPVSDSGRMRETQIIEGSIDELFLRLKDITSAADNNFLQSKKLQYADPDAESPATGCFKEDSSNNSSMSTDLMDCRKDQSDQLCGTKEAVPGEMDAEAYAEKKILIELVGTGMGSPGGLTGEAAEAIRVADYVLGAPRMIRPYQDSKIVLPYYTAEKVLGFVRTLQKREKAKETVNIAVLFSGDTGFYSGAQKLYDVLCEMSEENPNLSVRIFPGISSVSALSARTGYSWQDARILSTHGVPGNEWRPALCEAVRYTKKTFVLTSGDEDVRNIGRLLCENGLEYVRIFTGFQLSYEEERIPEMTAAGLKEIRGKGLYTLLIVRDHPEKRRLTQGMSDEAFDRIIASSANGNSSAPHIPDESNILPAQKSGQTNMITESADVQIENSTGNSTGGSVEESAGVRIEKLTGNLIQKSIAGKAERCKEKCTVPMTKEEIRDISIARLHLTEGAVVYDIGSGTGSVTCEIARLSPSLRVFAFECRPEAADLTRHNVQKFHLQNVTVAEEKAPQGMEDLPAPTHVFIGGSGGNLREILYAVRKKNSSARVVLNAVSLETVSDIMNLLPELGVRNEEIVQVSVSRARKTGRVHLMQAGNPVFIISFDLVAGTYVPAKK